MPIRAGNILKPLLATVETARHYSVHKLRKDLVAGLTVSVVEVPQAMAYAIVAGVPPVYGLYTSVIQGALGALLSSSNHLATGPTNTQSLLIASAVHRVTGGGARPEEYLAIVFALTILKGLMQLAFAAGQMGNMVRYVSRAVIAGLVSGAGLLIFFGQLPAFFGISNGGGGGWPGVVGPIQQLLTHLDAVNGRAALIGVVALVVIVGVRLVNRFVPAYLVAVVLCAAGVAVMGWTGGEVPLIEQLPPSLPSFAVPDVSWSLAERLLGGALALAIIGLLETVAIAKNIATHTGERINANQEFFAQGLTNFVSGFFQCIAGSGSFSRSALDHAAGAATRFAAVFNAGFVAVIFLLFGPWARYIPNAALAAVLLVIAYGLIEWRYFLRLLRTSRSDSVVCFVTFAATLVAPLEYAIFIGIFLNIGLYLRRASRLHLHEMIQSPGGGPFIETPIHDRSGHKQILFLQVEGDLFFGVADELQDRLTSISRSGVRVVILRLKRTHSIDTTCLHVLEQFAKQMHERNAHVILCGVRTDLMQVLKGYGLVRLLGRDNVIGTGLGVFESAKEAIRRAKKLVQASVDTRSLEAEMEGELSYEI